MKCVASFSFRWNISISLHQDGYLYMVDSNGEMGRIEVKYDLEGADAMKGVENGEVVLLSAYESPTHPERIDIGISEMREIAAEDIGLLKAVSDDALFEQAKLMTRGSAHELEVGDFDEDGNWVAKNDE